MEYYFKALARIKILIEDDSNNNLIYKIAVLIYQDITNIYYFIDDEGNAKKYHKLLDAHSTELLERNPGHAGHAMLVAQGHLSIGNFHRKKRRKEFALQEFTKGLTIIGALTKKNPEDKIIKSIFDANVKIFTGLVTGEAYDLDDSSDDYSLQELMDVMYDLNSEVFSSFKYY